MPQDSIETEVFDGLALANDLRARMAEEIEELLKAGHRAPCLAVVLVGDDAGSLSYIKGKQRACSRIGMDAVEHLLPEATTQDELLDVLAKLNADDGVDGIVLQGEEAGGHRGSADPRGPGRPLADLLGGGGAGLAGGPGPGRTGADRGDRGGVRPLRPRARQCLDG